MVRQSRGCRPQGSPRVSSKWWHISLHVTPQGLATHSIPLPDGEGQTFYVPANLKEVGEEPEPEPPLVPPQLLPAPEGEEESDDEERLLPIVCEQLAKRIVGEETKQRDNGGITVAWHMQHVKRARRWAAVYGDNMPDRAVLAVGAAYFRDTDEQERIKEVTAILKGDYE